MKRFILAIAIILCFPIFAEGQVPVSLMPVPRIQFLSASGQPLAGGLVYTSVSGSSTPLATYVDQGGTIQNTNPIVLDAGGFAAVWLQSSAVYRIRVTDQFGTQQWVVDGVTSPPNLLAPGPIGTSIPNIVESTEFLTSTTLPALSGIIRLASGDQICWRNNANSGDVCISKNSSDAFNFSAINAVSYNNVIEADQQFGVDPCAQIAAAIGALQGGSPYIGVVDARGFTAAQLAFPCAADPFTNLHTLAGSSYGTLLMPPLTGQNFLKTNAQWVIPNGWQLIGTGGSTIEAGPSFPINTAVVVLGDATPFSHGAQLYNVGINCNNVAGSGGLYSNLANEEEGWDHLSVVGCVAYGVKIEQTTSHSPQNWFARDTYIGMSASSTNTSNGVVILGTSGTVTAGASFDKWTAYTASSTPLLSCFNLSNVSGLDVRNGHCESSTNGILVANSQSILVHNLMGNSGVTDLVTISDTGGSVENALFEGLTLNGGTTLINDTQNTVTIADAGMGLYSLNSMGQPGISTTTNTGFNQVVANLFAQTLADNQLVGSGTRCVNTTAGGTFGAASFNCAPAQTFQPTAINATAILGTNTTLGTISSFTFPASGGPFRVRAVWSAYLSCSSSTTSAGIWVSDGTNVMAGWGQGLSSSTISGNWFAHSSGDSPVTYANGATETFTLLGVESTASACSTVASPLSGSGPVSTFQIEAVPSN